MNQPDTATRLPHLLIRASAGTGKTFQLSNRFLELLRRRVASDHILATTFTRKAAGEILDRVILRLAEAASDDKKRTELRGFTGGKRFGRDDCLMLLETVMQHLHRLRIGTLDSFFSLVARSFGLELGLPPGWQIIDELVDQRLRREAIHSVLSGGDAAELRTLIQLLTKGEASRGVSQVIRETVDGLYNLYLGTEAEAWHRIPRSKPLDPVELAETLEALRGTELPNQRMQTARDADYARAVQENWDGFLTTGLAKKVAEGEAVFASKPIPDDAVAIYQRLIEHVRAELVGRVALQTEASYRLLTKFHAEYVRLKHRHRAMRFEDVTRRLAELRDVVELDRMAFRLDSRIDHVLLDEFQDTSPEQWRVIQPLAERVTSGERTSFFCVGDVKQAIYGWRGGVAEIFDAIDLQLDGLEPLSLNISYRSSPAVIETVNRVFAGIADHPNLRQAGKAVRRWCERFESHRTARERLPGYTELQTAPLADESQAQREATLDFAARRIADLVREAPGRSVGVLVRKNETVGKLIFRLRGHHVLASEEGGNPLTDSAAVLIVLSALRMADHPADTVACFHLAHSPLADVVGMNDYRDSAMAAQSAARLRQRLVSEGYGPTVLDWARRLSAHCNRRELSRLQQLVEMAYSYDGAATLRADDFVQHVRVTRVADPVPADVRVMTVHQAKGLEFDIVVLPELDADLVGQPDAFVIDRPDVVGPIRRVCRYTSQMVQDLMPADVQQMFAEATDREVTESLCVLYVALTRAVHALHMIVPPSKPNEKTFPRTFAGLLRIALSGGGPAAPDSVLFQHGQPDWYRHGAPGDRPAAAGSTPQADALVQPVRIQLAESDGTPRRGWERVSPSGLEGGSLVQITKLLTAETKSAAFLQGQLMHAWFEQIEWIDELVPDDERLQAVAADILAGAGSGQLNLPEQIRRFRTLIADPAIAGILSRSRYANGRNLEFPPAVCGDLSAGGLLPQVQNERGFAYCDGAQLVQGFIDRLVLLHRGDRIVAAEILDYKTDTVDRSDSEALAAKIAFYTPQMQAYRAAVARLTHLAPERVAARLIFLQASAIHTVAW
ncbi:MAG: UvrD-helicase domain-containing protein [Pirellulaceae bacterium]|nr:UvrD-helicase domain-containing protein [Pirellulaceae bacterium]